MSEKRRRGTALEEVILEAAWTELNEVGFEQTTIASVAARARTGKQVLYRRWRSRAELAIAALNHHAGPRVIEPADSGSLRGDVLALLDASARRLDGVDIGILRAILVEFWDEDITSAGRTGDVMRPLIERAVARGELGHADIPARVLSVPAILARDEFARVARQDDAGNLAERLHEPFTQIVDEVFLPLVRAVSASA